MNEIVERARSYPFTLPDEPFLFVAGDAVPFSQLAREWADSHVRVNGESVALRAYCESRGLGLSGEGAADRLAVLAYGSNASCEALEKKFGGLEPPAVIPVLRAELANFDVVYSSHFSPYGSVPGTLQFSSGTTVSTFVACLTTAQAEHLHGSEPNYFFAQLSAISLALETGLALTEAYSYVSRHGCLRLGDSEIGLAAMHARGRRFTALPEAEVLELCKEAVSPGTDLDQFILENVRDPELAARRTAALKRTAFPFAWSEWRRYGKRSTSDRPRL